MWIFTVDDTNFQTWLPMKKDNNYRSRQRRSRHTTLLSSDIFLTNKTFLIFIVAIVSFIMTWRDVRAEDVSSPAVLELFTSQGCSSCPPADKVLGSYKGKKNVITLSYSVDYWDYLGWRDTFGSAANSKRQRDYARTRKDSQVYTPQMVINGLSHANGAIKYTIDDHLKKTETLLEGQRLSLVVERQGEKYIVRAGEGDMGKGAILWMARVQDVGIVNVKRGENHGQQLTYHNIVLGMKKLGTLTDQPFETSLNRNDIFAKKGEHCVLLLQKGTTGPILAAAELWP